MKVFLALKSKNNTQNTAKKDHFWLKMSEPDLFGMEVDNIGDIQSLGPTSVFQEIEQELSQRLFNNESRGDSTDGPLNFIENLVDNLSAEFNETLGESGDKNLFIRSLSKIFTILLSVKADGAEKIKQIVKIAINAVIKIRSGQN